MTLLSMGAIGQTAFSWKNGNSVNTSLALNTYTELKIDLINESGSSLDVAIEVIYNDLPLTWDGMVCVYGVCLGTIPAVGGTADMATLNENVKHYICSISSDPGACNTGYLNDSVTIEVDPKNVWTSVDSALSSHEALETDSGVVYKFTRPTLHKGMKAVRRCWRYFFRLSFYHMPAANRLRHQVQVYTNNVGW